MLLLSFPHPLFFKFFFLLFKRNQWRGRQTDGRTGWRCDGSPPREELAPRLRACPWDRRPILCATAAPWQRPCRSCHEEREGEREKRKMNCAACVGGRGSTTHRAHWPRGSDASGRSVWLAGKKRCTLKAASCAPGVDMTTMSALAWSGSHLPQHGKEGEEGILSTARQRRREASVT